MVSFKWQMLSHDWNLNEIPDIDIKVNILDITLVLICILVLIKICINIHIDINICIYIYKCHMVHSTDMAWEMAWASSLHLL